MTDSERIDLLLANVARWSRHMQDPQTMTVVQELVQAVSLLHAMVLLRDVPTPTKGAGE